MTPVNQQAQVQGSPRLLFTRGLPGGPMKVVMPSGESLAGYSSVSRRRAARPDGVNHPANFHAGTRMARALRWCARATLVAGHGPGECRGQDGAVYRLDL